MSFTADTEPVLPCADGKDDLAYLALIDEVALELAAGSSDLIERLRTAREPEPPSARSKLTRARMPTREPESLVTGSRWTAPARCDRHRGPSCIAGRHRRK